MNLNHEPRCVALNQGELCGEPATTLEPVRLCDEHKVQVAALVVPAILDGVIAQVRADREDGTKAVPPALAQLIVAATSAERPATDQHAPLVYFVANGGRVKVGFTRSLAKRLRALSLSEDSLLLLLHGGQQLERALHQKFASYQIRGTEWFELAPEVVHFIASKSPHLSPRRSRSRRPRLAFDHRLSHLTQSERQRANEEAVAEYKASVQAGHPLSERALARRFGRSKTWARARIFQSGVLLLPVSEPTKEATG